MELNEHEKAAVLLIALGPRRARIILNKLGADDLIPIVSAMKGLGEIPPEVRRSVLEEVNDLLQDITDGKKPRARPKSKSEPQKFWEMEDLMEILSEPIDPDKVDWSSAGFDFDEPIPPEDEEKE